MSRAQIVIFRYLSSFVPILWFDPRREHSSVPTAFIHRRRAQWRSRLAAPSAATEGLALTAASTTAGSRRTGAARLTMIRGEPAFVTRTIASRACIRLGPKDPDHEAVIRFCGKAPRRRVHSLSGIAAIAVFGLPPPRIVVGRPVARAAPAGYRIRQGPFSLQRSIRLPVAARRRPAPRRS